MTEKLRVAVFVGTDHHPFDRLVSIVDDWFVGTTTEAEVVIQHGSSAPPEYADGMPLIPHDEVGRLMADADVVVCHGGPATIADARSAGHVPLVMPRNPDHGEHVDNHQMLFSARLAQAGLVTLVRSEAELLVALEAAAADPRTGSDDLLDADGRALVGGDATEAAVDMIGDLVDSLIVPARSRRRGWAATPLARLRSRSAA